MEVVALAGDTFSIVSSQQVNAVCKPSRFTHFEKFGGVLWLPSITGCTDAPAVSSNASRQVSSRIILTYDTTEGCLPVNLPSRRIFRLSSLWER